MFSITHTLAYLTLIGATSGEAPAPLVDLNGDSLPAGAVARLGTLRFRYEYSNLALAYLPDGKHVVTAGHSICIWEAATGKMTLRLPSRYGLAFTVAVSPNGKMLATAGTAPGGHGEKAVRLWDAASGREIRQFVGAERLANPVAFSSDGRTLASISNGGTLQLWNVETGQEMRKFKGIGEPEARVKFSPDGKFLATGNKDGLVRVWTTATGKELQRFPGPFGDIISPTFSPTIPSSVKVSELRSKRGSFKISPEGAICQFPPSLSRRRKTVGN